MFLAVAALAPSPPGHPAIQKLGVQRVPFAAGEMFEYSITWNGIPAADGTAWVERSTHEGRECFDFQIVTKTNAVVDVIWKMRDSGKTTVDAATILPVHHLFLHQENERRRRYTATFDHAAGVVTCARELFDKNRVDRVRISYRFAFDPISASYFLRCLDWKVGDRRQLELVADNARYLFIMETLDVEKISVPAGQFRALKMRPILLKVTTRKKKPIQFAKDAYIWVTDDVYHIPLRLKSASFIGHIYVDLAKFKLGSGELPPSLCP